MVSERLAQITALNRELVGCPYCDAVWSRPQLAPGESARCRRCNAVILSNKPYSLEHTVAMMCASLILYAVAMLFPFLRMERSGLSNQMSVIDTTTVLWQSNLHLLAVMVGLFIIVFPVCRMGLLLYVSLVIWRKRLPKSHHALVFRVAQWIEPWTMAEIFVIGVIVSLVKIVVLARVEILPGFWAMAVMIVMLALGTIAVCQDTIWQQLRESS